MTKERRLPLLMAGVTSSRGRTAGGEGKWSVERERRTATLGSLPLPVHSIFSSTRVDFMQHAALQVASHVPTQASAAPNCYCDQPASSISRPRSLRTVMYCRWLVMSPPWYGTPM